MNSGHLAIATIALMLSAASCNTNGCLDNQSAIPLAECRSAATDQAISVPGLQIGGIGAPADSLLTDGKTAVSKVYLPMRSTADQTAWCLHYDQDGIDDTAFNDTIVLSYTSIPYFASEECGAMYHYHIDRVEYTRHLLQRVEIVDSLITNVEATRILLYFNTADKEQE